MIDRQKEWTEEDRARAYKEGRINTGSDAAVSWAKDKIGNCQVTHSDCKDDVQGALPSRVLSIAPTGSHDPNNDETWYESAVRLHESAGETSHYAALSHPWGSSQPLSLKSENISSFRQAISWDSLPKTFQQAIMFTRKLSISYLWIDSLCIIQDSKEDWLEQSGKMASIYEHSLVTLAATASHGASSGCFFEPSLALRGYITNGKTQMRFSDTSEVTELIARTPPTDPILYIRRRPSHNSPGYFTYPDLPLLSRGWVYQERLLSPRILHFGAIDLIWECNTDISCHCGYYTPSYSRNPISHPIKPQHAACVRKGSAGGSMASRWVQLVQQYTALDLTFDTDRLPAIAGVAKQFRRGLENKKYMAGLWEETLLTGLTWARAVSRTVPFHWQSRVRPLEARPRTSDVGPSWSWISVPGPITYPSSRYMGNRPGGGADIKEVQFEGDGEREFTALWGGRITLHGKLIVVKQRVIHTKDGPRYGVINPGTPRLFEVSLDFSPGSDDWHTIHPRYNEDEAPQVHDLPPDEDLEAKIPLYLSKEQYISTQQSNRTYYALYMGMRVDEGARTSMFMLLDASDGDDRVYTRLGLGDYSPDLTLFSKVDAEQDVVII